MISINFTENLPKKNMKKKSISKALRMKLWEQQFGDTLNGSCFSCNRNVKIDDFQAGHIIAEVNGGKATLSNLKVLCKPCNASCGTMDLSSFKESLEGVENPRSIISPKPDFVNNLFGVHPVDKVSNRITKVDFGDNVAFDGARNYGEVFLKF